MVLRMLHRPNPRHISRFAVELGTDLVEGGALRLSMYAARGYHTEMMGQCSTTSSDIQ